MIKEIETKSILSTLKEPDSFFGVRYNMNLYRGCSHQCIYCDSRSECYQIEDFNHSIEVKTNAITLLNKELSKKRIKGTIGTGSMNDPYMPIEKKYKLTRQALKAIYLNRFPLHIITKGTLVTRDRDILQEIHKLYAAISFSITTPHDAIARSIEPGAPNATNRFSAMKTLALTGLYTGVTLMPSLPWITDDINDLKMLINKSVDAGAQYIISGFGVTLRDRQRDHFFKELDQRFPTHKERYLNTYGTSHSCTPTHHQQLDEVFQELCYVKGIATEITPFHLQETEQLQLF
ncbi:MAG: radical SAM protein [Fibrobacterales bacterium]